ncbi:hypothetical protein M5K25_020338 [Dendrobium thyrsiflorum]|uniref:Uncharacterized protein n=1 Tax=Dendrobium thyrsiflorum TaxID=117978 RepID=A0ABD0U9L5_DENTH
MPALRQQPQQLLICIVCQTHRATGVAGPWVPPLGFRISHLSPALESGLVEPGFDIVVIFIIISGIVVAVAVAGWRRGVGGGGGTGAEVRHESDGGDEEEDADGDAEAVAKFSDPFGAEDGGGRVARAEAGG